MNKRIPLALLSALTLTAGCAGSMEPPVIVGGLQFPKSAPHVQFATGISVWLLPVTYSRSDKRLGTLFHALGSESHLLLKKPLTQSVQEEIQKELVNDGFSVQMVNTDKHPLAVIVSIKKIDDRVTAAPLNVRQKALVVLNYKIVSHPSQGVTKTISGTIVRKQSPTPDALFHRHNPPALIGSMIDDAVRTELVPAIDRASKESS